MIWVAVPLLIALIALAGSLWLSIGMKLKACPFCFYQRTFVMAAIAVLGVGLAAGRRHWMILNLLALPLVVGAFGVAVFHVSLELAGKLECPVGILGIGTAPQQGLAALIVLLIAVVAGLVRGWRLGEHYSVAMAAAVLLGPLLAWGAVASSPPMPPTPTKPYTSPIDTCRPPFPAQ